MHVEELFYISASLDNVCKRGGVDPPLPDTCVCMMVYQAPGSKAPPCEWYSTIDYRVVTVVCKTFLFMVYCSRCMQNISSHGDL